MIDSILGVQSSLALSFFSLFSFALKDHKAKENKAKKDKAREDWTPRIESIIDQVSPRLVGQRLYEAIRRSDMCIADWTLWRANVLYECGVRLAVTVLLRSCCWAKR